MTVSCAMLPPTMNESAQPQRPELQRTEIHGVPVMWADLEEPVAAGLVFRVGWVDEPVAKRGLTHLVDTWR